MHSIFQSKDYLPQQMVIYFVVFSVSSLFTLFILENRFQNKLKTFLISLFILYLSVFPKHFDGLPIWTNQLILSSFFLSIIFLYKDRLRTKILASVIAITITMLADYFSYFFAIVVCGESDETYLHKPYVFVMMVSIFSVLFFINALLWNRFYRNDKNNFFKNHVIILVVGVVLNINLLSVLIPIIVNINNYISPELKNSLNSFFMIYIISTILTYIFIFYFMKSSYRYQKAKDENEKLEIHNKLQAEYYRRMEENIQQTAKLRHDINNIVQTINAQLIRNTPESYEKAKIMTEELNELTEKIQPVKYCHNKVVDVILDEKFRLAKQHNITVICDVVLKEREDMSALDLCRIFANLLDNAITATQTIQKEEKKITVICREKKDGIYIKCENLFEPQQKRKLTRNDGITHGYGLKIIQEISKQYHGSFTIEQKNNQFIALVVLKTQKTPAEVSI